MATTLAARLDAHIKAQGVAITSVMIGRVDDRATWLVRPEHLQAAAQPHIDGFALPTEQQIADEEALSQVEGQRVIKATVLWTLRRLLGRAPTPAEIQTARAEWIAIYKML